ncbi:unnamed protein product, partial [Brenthis ino]
MKYFIAFVLFIGSQTFVKAENDFFPDYIHPCTMTEPDFKECVKKQMIDSLGNFSKGIPELGVNSTDPVNLDDIHIDGAGLKLKFTNAQMHGLSNSKLTQFDFNFGSEEESIKIGVTANLSLTAQYIADGQILFLPIKGEGDALIECYGIEVEFSSKLKRVKGSKGDHLKLLAPTYKYDIQSTTFDLKNLFNGNKEIAETTLNFVNKNWKQIMDELAPPVVKQIVKTIVKTINNFFSKVTLARLILEYKEKP